MACQSWLNITILNNESNAQSIIQILKLGNPINRNAAGREKRGLMQHKIKYFLWNVLLCEIVLLSHLAPNGTNNIWNNSLENISGQYQIFRWSSIKAIKYFQFLIKVNNLIYSVFWILIGKKIVVAYHHELLSWRSAEE